MLRGTDEKEVIEAANDVSDHLQILRDDHFPDVKIIGPAPAPLSKIDGKFRWHFLLRCQTVEKICELLQLLNDEPPTVIKSNAIEFVIDIDPTNTL